MVQTPVFLDNHSTTRVDPRVWEAMLPFFTDVYGNAGSTSHVFGWNARDAVDGARQTIAASIGADEREIVFTSGATESNNLAIRGVAERTRRKGSHLVTVATEHRAVLDPIARLGRRGFDVTVLPVRPNSDPLAGQVDVEHLAASLRDDTILVSVMLANNEIGVIQPLTEIAAICKERGVLLHCDATQAVGKIPVNVRTLDIDLMSFSGHKIHGPKGIGGLYLRRRAPHIRLEPQIDGGGQEGGVRSGTLNVPGIVGLSTALALCVSEMAEEAARLGRLREQLYRGLTATIADVTLNGPHWSDAALRLPGNLNCCFANVDGEALMISMRDVAVSSGSACTSTNPEPSHVLRALGIGDDLTRASLRFGIGRFNTGDEIDFAVERIAESVSRLRSLRGTP